MNKWLIKPWIEAHNFKEVKKDKLFELEINLLTLA